MNARSEDSRTALLIAAGRFGSREVVKLLLDEARTSRQDHPGLGGDMTAAYRSGPARRRRASSLAYRARRGLESGGTRPLAYAAVRAVREVHRRADCRRKPRDRLAWARCFPPRRTWTRQTVDRWLDRGADINTKDPGGNTLLMLAASSDSIPVEAVKTLIARGADVNARNAEGRSAMDFARLRGDDAGRRSSGPSRSKGGRAVQTGVYQTQACALISRSNRQEHAAASEV